MRLAWFSPMPPARTGVAGRSAEIVARLSRAHEIDVYVDRPAPGAPHLPAHDFVWKNFRQPYDLTVYQLGNSSAHDYLWAYLFHFPGLVVLHDTRLHHARASALLREKRAEDYRREFAYDHPDSPADFAELAVAGYDSSLYYLWPMIRAAVRSSRLVAVHNQRIAADLADADPEVNVEVVPLGDGAPLDRARQRAARESILARYGLDRAVVLYGCFGGITPEKRIPEILAALGPTIRYVPRAHLLLAGPTAAYFDVASAVRRQGLEGRVTLTGYLEADADLTDHIAASDVCLNLRWPTAGEISGPWIRCLAAGKPTIITDLPHLADVPALDPRTWTPLNAGSPDAPICVSVDVLDEAHSLRLAMRRLGLDAPLRETLGTAAQAWWRQHHSVDVMIQGYERAIARAVREVAPGVGDLLRSRDAGRLLDATLAEMGLAPNVLKPDRC